MKILVLAAVENEDVFIRQQIHKQTIQPDYVEIYVDKNPADTINNRRKRIVENHKILVEKAKQYKGVVDVIWQLEGDSVLKDDTLEQLIETYKEKQSKDLAYISGVQIGRHGIYCIGAWHVADDKKSFKSVDHYKTGIQEIDASGWYCLLANYDVWLQGNAYWSNEPYGPDVNWGLSLSNYKKYIDMNITIGHKVKHGVINPEDASTSNVRFYYADDSWKYKIVD